MGHSCNLIVIQIRRVLGDLGIPLGHDFNLILEWGMLLAYEVTHCQVIGLVLRYQEMVPKGEHCILMRCKIIMRVNNLHLDIFSLDGGAISYHFLYMIGDFKAQGHLFHCIPQIPPHLNATTT